MSGKFTICCTLVLFSFLSAPALAQNAISFQSALKTIEKKHQVRVFYRYDWIKNIEVDPASLMLPLREFFDQALKNNNLKADFSRKNYVIILPLGTQRTSIAVDTIAPEKIFKPDGKSYTLQGYVKEANTGQSITGATVYIEEEKSGVVTNSSGFFSVRLRSGIYNLKISAVGKTPDQAKVSLSDDATLSIELFEQVNQLKDVEVSAEAFDKNVSSVEMSLVKLDIKVIKSLPAFFGEADIIKSITLLPGVKTVGDGAGGFNVRGGAVDQNLILLDNVPIFNTSHLFGFFSAFNTDAVKDVGLYKGGMPAQYGGRISSVLDVSLRDGNTKSFQAKGSIGIISSKLFVEGPIKKDKTSFLIGGRYAYPNWVLQRVPNRDIQKSAGMFYDITGKINHKINTTNNISLSGYRSHDEFKLAGDTLYGWTTSNATLKWTSALSSRIFLDASGFLSQYDYHIEGQHDPEAFKAKFGVRTMGSKVDLSYHSNIKHTIMAGVSVNVYTFNTGEMNADESSSINSSILPNDNGIETGIYVSEEYKVNRNLTLYAGLRYSMYSNIGASEVYQYTAGVPKSIATIQDTLQFGRGERIRQYAGFEPRLSIKYSLTESSSVKLSYNRNLQYVHLISNTTAISPLDIWKTSNYHIKPQSGQQFAMGYFKNFNGNSIETSVEGYYKETDNMLEYKDGANLFFNPAIETQVLQAFGKSYGVELLVRRNSGKTTGWIGYTYSRSLRQVRMNDAGETINAGEFYPSNFDKPHDIAIVMNHKFNRRFSLSANFTYNTGRPITYPDEVYVIDGYTFVQFSERNQGRIPDYHRLDLSLTLDESLKQTKRFKGSWTFSVFNVYGRKNPYSVFFKPEFRGAQPQAYRLSVLGSIFPSLTYNFKIN
jgi:hypothetical protein